MALYYKYITVTVSSGAENVQPILISTQAEPKTVKYIVSSLSGDNIDLLVYLEREKRADIPVDVLHSDQRKLDLDIALPVGQQLYVGFRNKTGSSIQGDIAVCYEITTAR
ncbi:MAG: hypothetical protein QXU79_01600 [Candidatus Micrarchaeaceae archaeon]